MSGTLDDPTTFSGWVVCITGLLATSVVVAPVALANAGVAAIRGRDSEQALSTVMDPAAKVLDKAVKAADKHNDTIVKAGITAAIKRIGDASSGPGSRA